MTQDKILLASRYANHAMEADEIIDFENQLLVDNELKEHLSNYYNIYQSLKIHLEHEEIDQNFKSTLMGFNKKYFKTEAKVINFKSSIKWLAGVAAILIMGLLLWASWHNNLYTQYADGSVMMVTERSAESETSMDKAAALYNEKKYTTALPILAKEYKLQSQNAMVGFYYGVTLLETNQPEKSREVLLKIYKGTSAFKYDAAYYTALSYLKQNNNTDCKIWLAKVPVGTTHYVKANELLGKL